MLAVGVSSVGLLGMAQVSGYISDWASKRKSRTVSAVEPPAPPRSLRELILERKVRGSCLCTRMHGTST